MYIIIIVIVKNNCKSLYIYINLKCIWHEKKTNINLLVCRNDGAQFPRIFTSGSSLPSLLFPGLLEDAGDERHDRDARQEGGQLFERFLRVVLLEEIRQNGDECDVQESARRKWHYPRSPSLYRVGCTAECDRGYRSEQTSAGGDELQFRRLPARETRLQEYGEIADLVRYLVHENGEGGETAQAEGDEEGAAQREPVREVVDHVGYQVQVTRNMFLAVGDVLLIIRHFILLSLRVALGVVVELMMMVLLIVFGLCFRFGDLRDHRKHLLGNYKYEQAGEDQQAAVHGRLPAVSRRFVGPDLGQGMQKHVPEESAHGEAE